MIEQLSDMPPGVSGIRVSGRIGRADLEAFKPTMDQLLDTDHIRFVEVIDSGQWMAHTLHALARMAPGEVALFGLDELELAKHWAAGRD